MADKNKRGKHLRNDKAISRTRVNIGSAFQCWREFKECGRPAIGLVCFF